MEKANCIEHEKTTKHTQRLRQDHTKLPKKNNRKKRNQRCKENQPSTRIEREKIRTALIESCHKFIINTGCSVFLKILDTESDMAFVYSTDNMYNLYINNGLTQNKSCRETREVIEEAIVHVLSNSYSRSVKVEKERTNKDSNPNINNISEATTTNLCTDQDMETVTESVQRKNVLHVSTNQNVPNTSNHGNIVNNADVDIPLCNTKQNYTSNIVVPVSLKRNVINTKQNEASKSNIVVPITSNHGNIVNNADVDIPVSVCNTKSNHTSNIVLPVSLNRNVINTKQNEASKSNIVVPITSNHGIIVNNADVDIPVSVCNTKSNHTSNIVLPVSLNRNVINTKQNEASNIVVPVSLKRNINWNLPLDGTLKNVPMRSLLAESALTDCRYGPRNEMSVHNADVMPNLESDTTDVHNYRSGEKDTLHNSRSGNTDIMHNYRCGKKDTMHNSESGKTNIMNTSGSGKTDTVHNSESGKTDIMHYSGSGKTDTVHNSGSGRKDMLPNSESGKRCIVHYSGSGKNDILHNAESGKTGIMPNAESGKTGNNDYFTRMMYNEEQYNVHVGTITMHNLSECDSSDKNIQDFFKQKIFTRPFEEEAGAENEKNNHDHSVQSSSTCTSIEYEDLDMCIKTEPEETQEMIYQLAEAAIESVNANFQQLPEFSDSLKIENTARRKRGQPTDPRDSNRPAKTISSIRMREYRERLKASGRYEEIKRKERERQRNLRQKSKTEEQIQRIKLSNRERTGTPLTTAERQRRYRNRQKLFNRENYLEKERTRKRKSYKPSIMLSEAELTKRRAAGLRRVKKHWSKKKLDVTGDCDDLAMETEMCENHIIHVPGKMPKVQFNQLIEPH